MSTPPREPPATDQHLNLTDPPEEGRLPSLPFSSVDTLINPAMFHFGTTAQSGSPSSSGSSPSSGSPEDNHMNNNESNGSTSSSRRTFVVRRHNESPTASREPFDVYCDSTSTYQWSLPVRPERVPYVPPNPSLSDPGEIEMVDVAITQYLEDVQASGEIHPRTTPADVQSAVAFLQDRIGALSAKEPLDRSEANIITFYTQILLKMESPLVRETNKLIGRVHPTRSSVTPREIEFYRLVTKKEPWGYH